MKGLRYRRQSAMKGSPSQAAYENDVPMMLFPKPFRCGVRLKRYA
ncbi:MAG: hypothetical protein AAGC93_19500 [Cyanobacteria bacterium P01_F01_bin.53]